MKKFFLKHFTFFAILGSVLLVFSGMYIIVSTFTFPKAKVDAVALYENVTEEEYAKYVKNKSNEGIAINNIKKLYVQVDIKDAGKCVNREIIIPELNEIDQEGKTRSFYSGSSSTNNLDDENAQSIKYIIFDSTGLTLDDLKKLYADKQISVSIISQSNTESTFQYNISELLKEVES